MPLNREGRHLAAFYSIRMQFPLRKRYDRRNRLFGGFCDQVKKDRKFFRVSLVQIVLAWSRNFEQKAFDRTQRLQRLVHGVDCPKELHGIGNTIGWNTWRCSGFHGSLPISNSLRTAKHRELETCSEQARLFPQGSCIGRTPGAGRYGGTLNLTQDRISWPVDGGPTVAMVFLAPPNKISQFAQM
ncbi:MAG: hypothetical protein KDJ90_21735 [Nitratireductor sp.]|nr:hypothetical protein [Nitratireductor sp.]